MRQFVPLSEALAGLIPCTVEEISPERIERIRQLKRENPDANHKWIAVMAFDSKYAVEKALKGFTL